MSEAYQVPIRVVLEGTIEIEDCDSMEEAEIQALEEARRQLGMRRGSQDLEVTELETRC